MRPQGDASFARSFGTAQAGQAQQAAVPQAATAPSGPGLLSTGVQFLLAQTRTQEAAAAFPAPSNLERARDAYQRVQKRVRETINANVLTAGGSAAPAGAYAAAGHAAYASAAAAYEDNGQLEDDLIGE